MEFLFAALGVLLVSVVAVTLYVRFVAYPMIFADLVELANLMLKVVLVSEKRKRKGLLFVDVFESVVKKVPDKAFILFGDERHTYVEVNQTANRLANVIRKTEIVEFGGVMGVFMHNEPAYISTVFAIMKLGVTAALLNINLRGEQLRHCIRVGQMKQIICGRDEDLVAAIQAILPELQAEGVNVFWVKQPTDDASTRLPDGLLAIDMTSPLASEDEIPRDVRKGISYSDAAFYFYTSGTTGTPKAAVFAHGRLLRAVLITRIFNMSAADIMYISLPLFHSSGIILGVCSVVNAGATAVITKKFSASRFWDDVRQHRANIIQYIGEICRYLLAQPKSVNDGRYDHRIRVAFGNGLSQEIWSEFKNRFNVERITEFFASTEGNVGFSNLDGTVGSVGRYSPLMRKLFNNAQIVECNWETARPIRGADGKCKILSKGKVGLLLGKITNLSPFEGYVSAQEANERKIVHNVRVVGDRYFNTGDLLMIDANDYVYFKDRIGDTFRWKGENVASCEVASVLVEFPSVVEAIVYGVKIPGYDGRAGMAALVVSNHNPITDWEELYKHVTNRLPSYACPQFIRIRCEMQTTGTYKYFKVNLVREGFEPAACGTDCLFFMDVASKMYIPLDGDCYNKILMKETRLG